MGGGGSKSGVGSLVSEALSGVSSVSGKVGEIANNPTVQRVGQIASVGATLAGHPEIAAGISGGLIGAKTIAPIVSDLTGDLAGRSNGRSERVNYPTRYVQQSSTNNPELNARIAEMSSRRYNTTLPYRPRIEPMGGSINSIPPQYRAEYRSQHGRK